MSGSHSRAERRVGFFGGSFDPPHIGHVFASVYALSSGEVDEVWAAPVVHHAFEKQLTAFEHRVAMVRLAMAPVANVEVSLVERDMPPPNYTLHTIERLVDAHPDTSFRVVVGADAIVDRGAWFGFERLVKLAPLLLLGRAGMELPSHNFGDAFDEFDPPPPAVLPEISSSEVRHWLRHRSSAHNDALRHYVPRAVLDYIAEHDLYR